MKLIGFYSLLLVLGLQKPLNKPLFGFFLDSQSIHCKTIRPALKQWPSQTDRAMSKAGRQRNIIKAKKWWRKANAKDRWWQDTSDLNTAPQIRHLLLLLLLLLLRQSPPAARKFVTRLSGSLWAFLISSDFYFYPHLINLCRSSHSGSGRHTASSRCHLFSAHTICVPLPHVCQ